MKLIKLKYVKSRIIDWCTKTIIPPEELAVKQAKINDYRMLVFANEAVGRQIYFYGRYEKQETELLSMLIKPEYICFDVGANIGYFTLLMASKAVQGHVHAFEPNSLCYHLLKFNVSFNAYSNVIGNNCAVTNFDGETAFSIESDSAFSHLNSQVADTLLRNSIVPVISIDRYIETSNVPKVDLIKIDVEGAEKLVIMGAANLLNDPKRKPKTIMMEVVDEHLRKFSTSTSEIIDILVKYDYEAMKCVNKKLIPLGKTNIQNYTNIFFLSR